MRPDVRSAEYQLRASFSNTKVARSQFYPSLKLTASGAWTNNIGEIVNPAQLLLNLQGYVFVCLDHGSAQFEISRQERVWGGREASIGRPRVSDMLPLSPEYRR